MQRVRIVAAETAVLFLTKNNQSRVQLKLMYEPAGAGWHEMNCRRSLQTCVPPHAKGDRRENLHLKHFFFHLLIYRKYRSLGTPPRLIFQARVLHNQEDVTTDRYVERKLSTKFFENRSFRHWHLLVVVEQSSLESQSRGCAKTSILTVIKHYLTEGRVFPWTRA